ncbi:beta-neurotoxin Css9-like isoform X2 [Centruroides sculpturatus]|uniref:beta-neurotoxin Css9-like isoform X2 n=1 Tax=Centruroides sculpturatus TaxID=218467 RepID=UPI000C6ED9CE|nr:beta-neurotoxin Css9-like isoform X2 [Centruroides sculpturatus]
MKLFILIVASLLIIGVQSKDGYPMNHEGCKEYCVISSRYCEIICVKFMKAKKGYCYFLKLACYCEGLPEWAKVWESATNKCRA